MTRIASPLTEADMQALLAEPDARELVTRIGLTATREFLTQGAISMLTLDGLFETACMYMTGGAPRFFAPLENQSRYLH